LDFGRGIGIDAAPICGREFAVGCGEFIGFGEVELLFCAVLNSEELIAGYDFESVAGAIGVGALIVGQRRLCFEMRGQQCEQECEYRVTHSVSVNGCRVLRDQSICNER
jgi:hypothetical protein